MRIERKKRKLKNNDLKDNGKRESKRSRIERIKGKK